MSDEERELDRLYENLTLDPQYVGCNIAPEYRRGSISPSWWARPNGKQDIVYKNSEGHLHRVYGPAYVSPYYKYEIWYQNGEVHRTDGPAVILKNATMWFQNGKPHRLDGPAIIGVGRPKEYWIMGQRLSPKEYKKEIDRRKRKGLIK